MICPFCESEIMNGAVRCRNCKKDLSVSKKRESFFRNNEETDNPIQTKWAVFQEYEKYKRGNRNFKKYKYGRKENFMTHAEHIFFNALIEAVGKKYYIFPQAHLSTIVDHMITGQNWHAALKHINQKSVDFVLCNKEYLSPVLAIELDDRLHEKSDRVERDLEVEQILQEAGLPLLRFKNRRNYNPNKLAQEIYNLINEGSYTEQKIKVGDKVIHAQCGEGCVVRIQDKIVTVNFDNKAYGERKLYMDIAPLKKIG